MMLHFFNFTCNRDLALAALLKKTLYKYCREFSFQSFNTDTDERYAGYGNGSGWEASMLKLDCLRELSKNIKDEDYIVSVDSDVVFTSSKVFEAINTDCGCIGIKHQQPYETKFGRWGHMSGAVIFIRGDIAKKMGAMSKDELDEIRGNHFKKYEITETEDVVLSYLAKYNGAKEMDISQICSGNFEWDIMNKSLKNFYHLNYCPELFLGVAVTGKWDLPSVLDKLQIEL